MATIGLAIRGGLDRAKALGLELLAWAQRQEPRHVDMHLAGEAERVAVGGVR